MRRHSPLTLIALATLAACGGKKEGGDTTSGASATDSKPVGKGAVAAPGGSAWEVPAGTYVVDSGFRPDKNGFKFPNEGSTGDDPWLTPADMRKLFGDAVCMPPDEGAEPTPPGADCQLTPAAERWMADQVKGMKDGVCEGMAVASLSLFKKVDDPSVFGGDKAIELDASPDLKRLIGFYFVMQFTDPTESEARKAREALTPNDVLDKMAEALKGDDLPSFGFYHQQGLGGHAVVPYAIESKGDGLFWLRVYDNNAPGEERYIEFDRAKNTWKYGFGQVNAGVQADVWMGDAETHSLDFAPLSWRKDRKCPFCAESSMRQVSLHGDGHVVVSDGKGHKLGIDGGRLVNTLAGAHAVQTRAYRPGKPMPEPVYFVPANEGYDILLDGAGEKSTGAEEVSIFGGGMVAVVDGIDLSGEQDDHLVIGADGRGLKYKAGGKEAPVVRIAFDGAKADYLFQISDLDVGAGEELDFDIDPATGRLKVFDSGGGGDKYDLRVDRYTREGETTFVNNDVELGAGEADFIDFGAWAGEGKPMQIETDKGNDGSIDGEVQEVDEPTLDPIPEPSPEHVPSEPPPEPHGGDAPPPPPPDGD